MITCGHDGYLIKCVIRPSWGRREVEECDLKCIGGSRQRLALPTMVLAPPPIVLVPPPTMFSPNPMGNPGSTTDRSYLGRSKSKIKKWSLTGNGCISTHTHTTKCLHGSVTHTLGHVGGCNLYHGNLRCSHL